MALPFRPDGADPFSRLGRQTARTLRARAVPIGRFLGAIRLNRRNAHLSANKFSGKGWLWWPVRKFDPVK